VLRELMAVVAILVLLLLLAPLVLAQQQEGVGEAETGSDTPPPIAVDCTEPSAGDCSGFPLKPLPNCDPGYLQYSSDQIQAGAPDESVYFDSPARATRCYLDINTGEIVVR
jgi:hypothetical protein